VKKYQYILLDWDGNLARTLDIWLAALKVPLEKRGHSFSDEQIGANFTAFKERMEALGIADVDAMITEADKIATREVPNVELYPDALTTLESLRKAHKHIALVTTSRHEQIDPLLEKYHLQSLFDLVVCGDDVTHHKPHPEAIQKALELFGAAKSEAIMVGDSSSDISGAINAGVDSALFFPPEHAKFFDIEELKQLQPTYIMQDFRELTRIAV
jgi:HAD superfamily hydrolase (TIGR01509 family)